MTKRALVYIFGFLYRFLLKPVFFRFDPEKVHDRITQVGVLLGKCPLTRQVLGKVFAFQHPALEQEIGGVKFPNPIGLAAGFDKNAQLVDVLPAVGFGFMEVGSITGEPCQGNPKPRLWRLPKSKALVVYYGLKNDGAEVIAKRLKGRKFAIPLGISLAKTNSPDTCETDQGIADYQKAYSHFREIGDYITINISCPNAYGGQPFTDPDQLEKLLSALPLADEERPVFLKMPPDLPKGDVDRIIELARKFGLAGFVCVNLTKDRSNPRIKEKIRDEKVPEVGGISGKVVEDLANDLIAYIYKKTRGEFVIIGCGGVFLAEDYYGKIKLGASLIQLITGMVYQGPQLIGEINRGLVKLLKQDGFIHISEAVGIETVRT